MASRKRSRSDDTEIQALHKKWDEASCPICMDHPHNAVLLSCEAHEKGCRSYICDTSYRHSNCLDRFKKLRPHNRNNPPPTLSSSSPRSPPIMSGQNMVSRTANGTEGHGDYVLNGSDNITSFHLAGGTRETSIQVADEHSVFQGEGILETGGGSETPRERTELEETIGENSAASNLNLRCPMCRGTVLGWKVVQEARKYLNLKHRSCSHESCSYSGNYRELRRHARRVHPAARPADLDPSRQRAWCRLERQREYADIVSAVRSAIPGAIVIGDHAVENRDREPAERESASGEDGPWWSTFFLFQMIGSMYPEPRGRSRVWSRHRRPGGAFARRRYLWGENLLGLQDDHDDSEENDDDFSANVLPNTGEDESPIPRRRRRLTRSRSEEDQS